MPKTKMERETQEKLWMRREDSGSNTESTRYGPVSEPREKLNRATMESLYESLKTYIIEYGIEEARNDPLYKTLMLDFMRPEGDNEDAVVLTREELYEFHDEHVRRREKGELITQSPEYQAMLLQEERNEEIMEAAYGAAYGRGNYKEVTGDELKKIKDLGELALEEIKARGLEDLEPEQFKNLDNAMGRRLYSMQDFEDAVKEHLRRYRQGNDDEQ